MISRPTPLHVLSKYRPVSTSLNRTMPPSKQKQDGHFWSHSNHMKIHINHVQIIIRPLFLCGSKNIFFPFFKSYCVKSVELNPMTQMANICLLSLFQHTLVCLNLSVDECCVTDTVLLCSTNSILCHFWEGRYAEITPMNILQLEGCHSHLVNVKIQ